MMKKGNTILLACILIYLFVYSIQNPNEIIDSVNLSISIWIKNIVPTLFPFFVLSHLLLSIGLDKWIGELFKPLMYRLFKIKGETALVWILSMFGGFPSGARTTRELYLSKAINEMEASKLLTFTHFANPAFILVTVGVQFLHSMKLGTLILIIHYVSNILVGFLFRNYYVSERDQTRISIHNAFTKMHEHRIHNKRFGVLFSEAIKNSIDTLLLIFGTVSVFIILTSALNISNPFLRAFISGCMEMTQGLYHLSLLDLSIKNKVAFATLFLSFSGLSVHMQVLSIISDTKIKYYPFLIARILHATISFLLTYLYFSIIQI